jgi:hypothetical protein
VITQSNGLTGDEWQELVIKLLYLRYGADLMEVLDDHGGDGGIEALSLDGCAFQCYFPEDSATMAGNSTRLSRESCSHHVQYA